MNILGIDNIVLGVTDLDAARHFYGTVLGLTEKYAFLDRGVVGYAIGDETPGFVIRLNPEADYADQRGPRIWLEVDDARAAVEELGLVTLAPLLPVGTGYVAEVTDPFGNVIGLADYTLKPTLERGASSP